MIDWNGILDSPLIPAIGWSVLYSFWQILLLGFIAHLGLRIIAVQKAQQRYFFAFVVLLMMGGLFIWNFNHQYRIAANNKAKAALFITSAEAPEATFPADLPIPETVSRKEGNEPFEESIRVQENTWRLNEWLLTLKPYLTKSLPWLSLIWLIGVFLLSFKLISGWWYLQRWTKQSARPVNSFWQNKLTQLKKRMGIHISIRFLESPKIAEPLTFGWLRPVIMIPLGILSQLSPEQLEAVLLHELAHIRRNDFIANVLQSLIEILLFFHPVMWWLSRKIRDYREDCCDDLAANYCGDRHNYASSLLQVRNYSFNFKNQLTMHASGTSGRLTARIQRLFVNPNPKQRFNQITPLISLLLIFTFLSLYAFTDIFSGDRAVSISADKMNVFYVGVDNPVTAAVAGIPSEKIRLSSDDVSLENKGNGHYNVKATKTGKAIISVSGEGLEPREIEFRVKRLPDPVAVLNFQGRKSSGGNATLKDFKSVKGIELDFGNFNFDVDLEVVSYQMTWVAKQKDPVSSINHQAAFTEKTKELVEKAQPGDIYYFDNVIIRSKEYAGQDDQVSWKVNSMVFKIK